MPNSYAHGGRERFNFLLDLLDNTLSELVEGYPQTVVTLPDGTPNKHLVDILDQLPPQVKDQL